MGIISIIHILILPVAVVANINESGLWAANVTTTQSGLLNPIAIELYQCELEATSTILSKNYSELL